MTALWTVLITFILIEFIAGVIIIGIMRKKEDALHRLRLYVGRRDRHLDSNGACNYTPLDNFKKDLVKQMDFFKADTRTKFLKSESTLSVSQEKLRQYINGEIELVNNRIAKLEATMVSAIDDMGEVVNNNVKSTERLVQSVSRLENPILEPQTAGGVDLTDSDDMVRAVRIKAANMLREMYPGLNKDGKELILVALKAMEVT